MSVQPPPGLIWEESPLELEFWSYVDRPDPAACWMWKGMLDGCGRPMCLINGVEALAVRIAWTLTVEPLDQESRKLHFVHFMPGEKNARCVNPKHHKLMSRQKAITTLRYDPSTCTAVRSRPATKRKGRKPKNASPASEP